ncbi:hypothetical protein QVD17_02266 [Tagetes erecta]|uniref:Uncharacterized protein n=1 Tax=Tagetes erecta TaxID=13708 RepID=A0AAD8P905_TARER|nr:hypothetical protein QVD17_02266 [Tagetes erecta]
MLVVASGSLSCVINSNSSIVRASIAFPLTHINRDLTLFCQQHLSSTIQFNSLYSYTLHIISICPKFNNSIQPLLHLPQILSFCFSGSLCSAYFAYQLI